jgi:hypothetical protein
MVVFFKVLTPKEAITVVVAGMDFMEGLQGGNWGLIWEEGLGGQDT